MKDSEIAYEKIKQKIITTELMPGEIISESNLMKELEMGRTPIREALNKLSFEEQVRIIPRQCILVTEQPNKDLDAIFQMRYTISELEGELAASRRSADDIQILRDIVKNLKTEENSGKRVMLDRDFHRQISKMTKNPFLEKEMNILLDLSIRLIFLNQDDVDNLDTHLVDAHEKIINSIEAKDKENTIKLLQQHVVEFRNKFMR